MAYKTLPARRKTQKVFHVVLHLIALAAGVLGICLVFKFHNEAGFVNMYSLHSWLGIVTISLFAFQWLFSFFSFAYPGAQSSTRAKLRPWHAVMGMIIFMMAILTAEMGLVERFFILRLHTSQEALVVNFIGLLFFLFSLFVGLVVVLPPT
ncbi:hypothetical protein ACS0TY_001509 [Phlomoides rotata]